MSNRKKQGNYSGKKDRIMVILFSLAVTDASK